MDGERVVDDERGSVHRIRRGHVTPSSAFGARSRSAQHGTEADAQRRVHQATRGRAAEDRLQCLGHDVGIGQHDERRRAHVAAAQVRADFESLQDGYNRIVLALSPKRAAEAVETLPAVVAEVNKCAARLRQSLSLPRPADGAEQQKPQPAPAAATDDPLPLLGRHLHSFLTNPLFESPGVLDVEQAARAARDLERVIELSGRVKRDGIKRK